MKRNETQSLCLMPEDFANDVEYELSHSNAHSIDDESAGGFVEHVAVVEFKQICIWLQNHQSDGCDGHDKGLGHSCHCW
jgi:hypothetical protein